MQLNFRKATKEQAKLRAAFFGPSGAGKTFTALRVAKGLGGKVALIDTERGSASKYADRFDFDVLELPEKDIDTYVAGMRVAARAGYDVLVIDSLSHAWQELLGEIDRLAKGKYKGNTWSAWSEGTPKQRQLIDALLDYPGHVIATMRSKTEWSQETNDRGKSRPVRVGLTPEQGKGIEYEFDFLLELSVEHMATVIKDRSGKFQDAMIEKPGEEFGTELAGWLADGAEPSVREERLQEAANHQPDDDSDARDGRVPTDTWQDLCRAVDQRVRKLSKDFDVTQAAVKDAVRCLTKENNLEALSADTIATVTRKLGATRDDRLRELIGGFFEKPKGSAPTQDQGQQVDPHVDPGSSDYGRQGDADPDPCWEDFRDAVAARARALNDDYIVNDDTAMDACRELAKVKDITALDPGQIRTLLRKLKSTPDDRLNQAIGTFFVPF